MANAGARRSRPEQVELNRSAVLDAAHRTFTERGYLAATLDEIAERAGFSKGVVYSQFGSKADLFLSVLQRRVEDRAAAHRRRVAEVSRAESFEALAALSAGTSRRDAAWGLALIEFRTVAARDGQLLERYRAVHDVTVRRLSELLAVMFEQLGIEPSVPVEHLARATFALDVGGTLESLAAPEPIDVDTMSALVLRLVLGPDRPATKEDR
jgi:AcrR family transcriptional regulator